MKRPIKVSACSGCDAEGKVRKVRYPERYLCLTCRKIDQDLKKRHDPIRDPQEARVAYELYRAYSRFAERLPDYDTLKNKFESDYYFKEIGEQYGISRQRIQQIHKRFFSLHILHQSNGNTRRIVRLRKWRKLDKLVKLEQVLSCNPEIYALKLVVESLGLKIQAISIKGLGGRIILIGGKHCAIYSTRYSHRVGFPKEKYYWSFLLNPTALKISEFVVLVAREGERHRFFIVPTHKFPGKFFGSKSVVLYVPQKRIDPDCRTGRKSAIDIHQYENQWGFLIGQSPQYKKTASVSREPSVPPSGLTR